jgi:hypothetical protein
MIGENQVDVGGAAHYWDFLSPLNDKTRLRQNFGGLKFEFLPRFWRLIFDHLISVGVIRFESVADICSRFLFHTRGPQRLERSHDA